jgi:UDP-2,3-diacylglucosamine pyrophosphatase LpxH
MPSIRWVCVSDLHLGALNSVLSSVHPDGDRVDQSLVSPVLTALCDCLRALRDGADPPQLVVLGDLFELALCSTDDAAATFAHMIEALRPGSPDAAVAPVIRFLPGNHDHHFWSRARGDCYVEYMAGVPRGQTLLREPHATRLLPANDTFKVRDRIVELMAARAETAASITVEQSYPNLGLVDATGGRVVVLSHGHFIEPLYRAMSTLDDIFERGRTATATVDDLEAENGAWIDFFWSSMGDSGHVSAWSRDLYESLQSDDALEAEIKAIRRAIVSGQGSRMRKRIGSIAIGGMLLAAVKTSLRRERHVPEVLSRNADTGLNAYLSGAVSTQVTAEIGEAEEVAFVFGHTHKPFLYHRQVPGLPGTVPVINTGGWVVDTPEAEPNKGAVVVLIDEDLNVATLRCFVQGAGPEPEIRIEGPDSATTNPLVDDLRSRIDPARDPWRALTNASDEIERERRRQLAARVRAGTVRLDETPAAHDGSDVRRPGASSAPTPSPVTTSTPSAPGSAQGRA